MHNKRNQIDPHDDTNPMSQSSDSSTIVRVDTNEQKQPRRRSLDNLLGNMIARDERTHEEVVREKLRQVIIKHHDWDAYLTGDPDYAAFVRNWSSCWWCSYSLCPNRTERHYLESLDEHFQCALHYAVRHNNLRVCQSLIQEKKCDINTHGINGETVLHMYASRQRWSKTDEVDPGEQILRLLFTVKSELNIDARDDQLQTPLHHAVKHNNYAYVKWLIDHGANATKTSRFYETPLHLACSLSLDSDCFRMTNILLYAVNSVVKKTMLFSNEKTLNILQQNYMNMCDAEGKTALCRAAENNLIETVTFLLPYVGSSQWETTLVSAIKSDNRTILTTVLEANNHHSYLNTPILHLACKLNHGRRIMTEQGSTKTELTSSTDQDQIIPFLVESLHMNTISNYNKEGYTPILLAAHFGYVDCLEYLLFTSENTEHQILECTKTRHQNIFHICAEQAQKAAERISSYSGHSAICKLLLQEPKYRDITERLLSEHDHKGHIPLHIACQKNNIDLCKLIISYMRTDVYLFVRDLTQRSALHISAQVGNSVLLKILLPDTLDRQTVNTALNGTRDINGKTPLHLACTVGNLDVIRCFVEEFNACLTTQAENRETLIASACANGHLNVVNYLLETADADTTIRSSKGLNALDIAIVNSRPKIVRRLLECDNWRRLMENAYYDNDGNVSTPMRELIILMPNIAYEVIDRKLTRMKESNSMVEHQTIYDYTFFEDQYHIRDWMYGDDCKRKMTERNSNRESKDVYTNNSYILVRNHPLLIVAQSEQIKLMEHEYCTRLCKEKFRRFGLGFFTFFSIAYILFVIFYTVIALESKHPFYYYNLYNVSANGTLVWDFGHDLNVCRKVGMYLLRSKNSDYLKSGIYEWILPLLYILLILLFFKNVCMIIFSFPRVFRKLALYYESLALSLCLTFISNWYPWQRPLKFRCPYQWQLGSLGLLLTWIGIIAYMRYAPWLNSGLYVVMIQVIFSKFLRCLPLLLSLIGGFGFTFYMLLQYQTVYGTVIEALLRTAVSLYDLGYEAHLYTPSSNGIMLYPIVYVVIIASEITLMIIITNLLIGLAVGEIPTLKTQAMLTRSTIFYELLFDYEFLHMQLKRFARFLLKYLRYCLCSRCRCSMNCAVHARDYMTITIDQRDKPFLLRWMQKIEEYLVEKQVQSAIIDQKAKKKTNSQYENDLDV